MRKRNEIERDPKQNDFLILETLLDIRDLLLKKETKVKQGRPKKK